MLRGTPHHCISFLYALMNVNSMNYYVRHKFYCNAAIVGNVGIVASSIDCLEAIHDELFFELNGHATLIATCLE